MPLGEIKHNIDEQAKREARGIHDDAESQRESILSDATAKAKELAQRADRELADELKRLAEENESSIELAAKNIMLSARDDAIEQEVSRIRRLLAKNIRKSQHYEKIFKDALRQAKGIAPADELIVTVAKQDRPLAERFGAKVEVRDIGGGLLIKTRNGDTEINATLDKLIDSKVDAIRSAVLGEMFSTERKVRHQAKVVAKAKTRAKARTAKKKVKAKKKK